MACCVSLDAFPGPTGTATAARHLACDDAWEVEAGVCVDERQHVAHVVVDPTREPHGVPVTLWVVREVLQDGATATWVAVRVVLCTGRAHHAPTSDDVRQVGLHLHEERLKALGAFGAVLAHSEAKRRNVATFVEHRTATLRALRQRDVRHHLVAPGNLAACHLCEAAVCTTLCRACVEVLHPREDQCTRLAGHSRRIHCEGCPCARVFRGECPGNAPTQASLYATLRRCVARGQAHRVHGERTYDHRRVLLAGAHRVEDVVHLRHALRRRHARPVPLLLLCSQAYPRHVRCACYEQCCHMP